MTLEDVVKTRLCLAAAGRVAKRGAGAAGRAFGTGLGRCWGGRCPPRTLPAKGQRPFGNPVAIG
jgi:hypothetical protein